MYRSYFCIFAVGPKNADDFWLNLHLFRAAAVPGAPGARRGPQGAENRPTNPAKIRPGRPICGPEALVRDIAYFWEGLGAVFIDL